MKTIPAGNFKTHCLALIDQVSQTHETVVITKYGKPKAKLVPVETATDHKEKPLKGMATFIGDIISPIDEKWETEK